MKKFSVKTVVAIGIGAALFFVLGKIAIPSPVANTNISLQYAILAMFATLFGPIAGALIGFNKKKMIKFNIAQIVAHLVAWAVVAPVLDIVIYSEPVEKLFAQGLMASIANIITTGVVGTLLLFAYSKTLVKKGSLSKED